MNKLDAFEYLLFKLTEWYEEKTDSNQNDLSVLKTLKLLFFVSAVGTTKNSKETLLDDVFDNFVAMPYGHVESDIYTNIKNNSYKNITINNSRSVILETFNQNNIEKDIRSKIDSSINILKKINTNLIQYSSFDLVDLSHSWYSWQFYFDQAKKANSFSQEIPSSAIKEEEKIYML